jgi:mycolipenoyl-CoA---2-(long-chain-fatty acyl)-trehalose mycolipenoyltransferase / long-chain-acyl-CoA---trehalose acyltransferase
VVAIKGIHEWLGAPGAVVSWHPSQASRAKVQAAPVSDVPVSYQQAQHLRGFTEHAAQGTDMARLNIPAWDIPGRCDLRAMTYVINAYIRRHDTYHSWFDYTDADNIVRRTVRNPKDIKFVPTEHGEMTSAEWRDHVLATPDPTQWDCFHFGIIQRDDHFTFYVSVDHVHTDAMFMGLVLVEIHMMYAALVSGAPPIQLPDAGSYDDYCIKQRDYTSALTLDSPEVRGWIEFAHNNDGTLPRFPLPLGDPSQACGGELLTVDLLSGTQTERFEAACMAAGARFSGGVLACAALAEHQLTGTETYSVITPTTTRNTPVEFLTTGWFTGLVPITVPVTATSFADTARAAQVSFDSGIKLANVPFDRVLELAGSDLGLRRPDPGVPMVSYLDAGLPPLSPGIIAQWEGLNGKVYSDARSAHQVGMWVNRVENKLTVTVAFPDNPIATESVFLYLEAMKAAYIRVADGRGTTAPSPTRRVKPAADACLARRHVAHLDLEPALITFD